MLQPASLCCLTNIAGRYILQPGRVHEPDNRCIERLLDALKDPGSRFRAVLPMPVQTILTALSKHDLPSITKAWWDYHAGTEFFRHSQTAKLVRNMLKGAGEEACEELAIEAGVDEA